MKRKKRDTDTRMDESMIARISDAAALLERLYAPDNAAERARVLAREAADAYARGDFDAFSDICQGAQPYLDLSALLLGGSDAMRSDPALIGRIEGTWPQIAWFIRAQLRLSRGADAFSDLTDVMIDGMRTARDESPLSQYDDGGALSGALTLDNAHRMRESFDYAACAPAYSASAIPDFDQSELESACSGARGGTAQKLSQDLIKAFTDASHADFGYISRKYPELGGIQSLYSLLSVSESATDKSNILRLIRCSISQACSLDDAIQAALSALHRMVMPQFTDSIDQAIWDRLFGVGGEFRSAMDAIARREFSGYKHVRALCRVLLIPGMQRSMSMNAFCAMLSSIHAAECARLSATAPSPTPDRALDWFLRATPSLVALSLWRAVSFEG